MIGNIRNSFMEMLNQSTWMDNISKVKAIEKVYIYIYILINISVK